jgi:hypothetical protein
VLTQIFEIKKENFKKSDIEFLVNCMRANHPPDIRKTARNRIVYLLRDNYADYQEYLFEMLVTEKKDTWFIRNLAETLILLGDTKMICRVLNSINAKNLNRLIKAKIYSLCNVIIKTSLNECLKKHRQALEELMPLIGGDNE